jgi:hypothetical protein
MTRFEGGLSQPLRANASLLGECVFVREIASITVNPCQSGRGAPATLPRCGYARLTMK